MGSQNGELRLQRLGLHLEVECLLLGRPDLLPQLGQLLWEPSLYVVKLVLDISELLVKRRLLLPLVIELPIELLELLLKLSFHLRDLLIFIFNLVLLFCNLCFLHLYIIVQGLPFIFLLLLEMGHVLLQLDSIFFHFIDLVLLRGQK